MLMADSNKKTTKSLMTMRIFDELHSAIGYYFCLVGRREQKFAKGQEIREFVKQ